MLDAQAARVARMEGEESEHVAASVRPDDPAMVTPFDENRELDLDKAQALAARLVDGGSDSLIINGTTGESPTVFYPQKMELFRAVVEAVGNRVPVIANVGDNCTADTVASPATWPSWVSTLYVRGALLQQASPRGMYRHFRTIADAVELPIILYNIPGRCVVNMEAETTLRLAHDCDNVVAVKEASGKMDQSRPSSQRSGRLRRVLRRRLRHARRHEARRRRSHLHHRQRVSRSHEGDRRAGGCR